jgi:hypothetical protein
MATGLMAHVDTKRTSLENVLSIPTPPRTRTYGAIGHGELIESLSNAIVDADYEVISQEYSLSKDGGKMFGVWALQAENAKKETEAAKMVGFRNSLNKTMAVGLTAGRRVFVCDNLVFSGEFITYHKHTGRLTLEYLQEEAHEAIESMGQKLIDFENWHESLKKVDLTRDEGEELMCEAVRTHVLPEGQMGKFWRLYFNKKNDDKPDVEYEDNLYGFHGAVTQIWSKNSLIGTGSRHRGLVKLMDLAKQQAKDNIRLDD